jgi:hypothetical protein
VVELAACKRIAPAADEAASLPPIILADERFDGAFAGALDRAVDRQSVEAMVVTVNAREPFARSILPQPDAAAGDLPAVSPY